MPKLRLEIARASNFALPNHTIAPSNAGESPHTIRKVSDAVGVKMSTHTGTEFWECLIKSIIYARRLCGWAYLWGDCLRTADHCRLETMTACNGFPLQPPLFLRARPCRIVAHS